MNLTRGSMHRHLLAIVVLLVGMAVAGCGGDGGASKEIQTISLKADEVLLEPAGTHGPYAFDSDLDAGEEQVEFSGDAGDDPTAGATADAKAGEIAQLVGTTAGLYGGTTDNSRCDSAAIASFLADDDDKAAAWVKAFNDDESFRWDDGSATLRSDISVDEIADYLDTLTPVLLTRDTRVTNHGYDDGKATPRQSILQAGTAVLIDAFGVPRVRCACGNPLAPPQPVTGAKYVGDPWDGFKPAQIVSVTPSDKPTDALRVRTATTRGDDKPMTFSGSFELTGSGGSTPVSSELTFTVPAGGGKITGSGAFVLHTKGGDDGCPLDYQSNYKVAISGFWAGGDIMLLSRKDKLKVITSMVQVEQRGLAGTKVGETGVTLAQAGESLPDSGPASGSIEITLTSGSLSGTTSNSSGNVTCHADAFDGSVSTVSYAIISPSEGKAAGTIVPIPGSPFFGLRGFEATAS